MIDTGICQVKQYIEFLIYFSIRLIASIQSFKIKGITTHKLTAVTFGLGSSEWTLSCKNMYVIIMQPCREPRSDSLIILLTLGLS